MNSRCIPTQIHERRFASHASAAGSGAPLVASVPPSLELVRRKVVVHVVLVAAIDRVRGVVRHHAVVGKRQSLASIPRGCFGMAIKQLNHLQHRCQPPVPERPPISALLRHVYDDVANAQTRREAIGSAQAGDQREIMLQIRFSSNRSINEWWEAEPLAGITASSGQHQRTEGVDVERWRERSHAADSAATLLPPSSMIMTETTPAVAGAGSAAEGA